MNPRKRKLSKAQPNKRNTGFFKMLFIGTVRAFIIILGVTMKAVAFESQPEINGFVEKLVIFL